LMTIIGIVAERHQWNLVDSTFTIVKHMSTEPPRRIAQIDVTFRLPASLSPSDRTLLERSAHTCPVTLSLHPDVKQNVVFEYQ